MPSTSTRPTTLKRSRNSSTTPLAPKPAAPKTEVSINVYDLLPPGRLSSVLWTLGFPLLHTGVVIHGREYAYGGHSQKYTTGVYWTSPHSEPPGGTWRAEVLQGFTFMAPEEVACAVAEVSAQFQGTAYNLLTNNCNHFASALCERLTGKAAPGWINRAASVGLALPCVVPREWINPPDWEGADGELLEEEEEDGDEEREAFLESERRRRHREEGWTEQRLVGGGDDAAGEEVGSSLAGGRRVGRAGKTPPAELLFVEDTSGRQVPAAERAPIPRR